jgi:hypothetical protein
MRTCRSGEAALHLGNQNCWFYAGLGRMKALLVVNTQRRKEKGRRGSEGLKARQLLLGKEDIQDLVPRSCPRSSILEGRSEDEGRSEGGSKQGRGGPKGQQAGGRRTLTLDAAVGPCAAFPSFTRGTESVRIAHSNNSRNNNGAQGTEECVQHCGEEWAE